MTLVLHHVPLVPRSACWARDCKSAARFCLSVVDDDAAETAATIMLCAEHAEALDAVVVRALRGKEARLARLTRVLIAWDVLTIVYGLAVLVFGGLSFGLLLALVGSAVLVRDCSGDVR